MSISALLYVDPQMVLVSANSAGARLLREARLLRLAGGRAEAVTPEGAAFFDDLLARASDRGYTALLPQTLAGEAGKVLVTALRPGAAGSHLALTLMSIRTLAPARPLPTQDVMAIFGLSQAEAEVAIELSAGASVEEVAVARGVNVGTLRAQLRMVYAKLGVKTMPQMVSALWRASAL